MTRRPPRPLSPRAMAGDTETGTVVERMARAMALAEDEDYMESHSRYHRLALAGLGAMREYRPVVREKGTIGVVAELRGAPADIWVAFIDAAIAEASNAWISPRAISGRLTKERT